jgi:hypothetical protein
MSAMGFPYVSKSKKWERKKKARSGKERKKQEVGKKEKSKKWERRKEKRKLSPVQVDRS